MNDITLKCRRVAVVRSSVSEDVGPSPMIPGLFEVWLVENTITKQQYLVHWRNYTGDKHNFLAELRNKIDVKCEYDMNIVSSEIISARRHKETVAVMMQGIVDIVNNGLNTGDE